MPNIIDRILSAITYFTFGIFGIIWLVYALVAKKPVSKFALFNIYQSFVVSLIFALIGLIYDWLIKLGLIIGFFGKIIGTFDIFFNRTPIYFGFSISGLLVTIFIGYLILFSLIGKRPFIPVISDAIETNIGV